MTNAQRSKDYGEWLTERLSENEQAEAYLSIHLEPDEDGQFDAMLRQALHDVAKVHGMELKASQLENTRDIEAFIKILDDMGFKVVVQKKT